MSTPAASESFAPAGALRPRVLILGSHPGQQSLQQQQYYAHPRNRFWPLMGTLLGFDAKLGYPARLQALSAAGVALWDVLARCVRPGSLDSAIQRDSEVANDLAGWLPDHDVQLILFNGRAAAAAFDRHIRPVAGSALPRCLGLPSTSPANAAWSLPRLCEAWQALMPALQPEFRPPAQGLSPFADAGTKPPAA